MTLMVSEEIAAQSKPISMGLISIFCLFVSRVERVHLRSICRR